MATAQRLSISEIGEKIAMFRKLRGMTQQKLAELVNEDSSNISRIEKGNRPNLSVEQLQRIAEALDVSMNDLCYETPENQSPRQEQDPIIIKAIALISTLSPEDRLAALRMLRGLSQQV